MENEAATFKPTKVNNSHLKIVVAEGKVTLEDLHLALDRSIKEIVRGGAIAALLDLTSASSAAIPL